MLRRFLIGVSALALVVVAGLAGAIALDSPAAPAPLAAGNSIPGIAQWNFADLPKLQTLKARDGAPLNYRVYHGRPDRAVVLVHGSSGTDASMLKLAQALQAAGATVYAIDLRGHGGSGTANGDVSYIGQLDDDLADLVNGTGLGKPGVHRTLIGFSSGGGFALRIAGGRQAGLFDDYIAISPYIGQDSPTNRPGSGGWAGVAVPRVVALSLLNDVGLAWFQDLPAVHFATDAKPSDRRTPVYSFRLAASLQLSRDWRGALARITEPTEIVVGADDQLFVADQFKPMLQSVNPRIGVTIVPGETHLGMIANPAAMGAIVAAWRKLAGD
jgi:alpha-beta hydrolase superfamily lysophospholipase